MKQAWRWSLPLTLLAFVACDSELGAAPACAEAGGDTDDDQVCDAADNCPEDPNSIQADADGDGLGDACDPEPDRCDAPRAAGCDAAPSVPVSSACDGFGGDPDADGVCQVRDNCPDVANASQRDADADGEGDACDATPERCAREGGDDDSDGICSSHDNCPDLENPTQLDRDGDGIGDACDEAVAVADRVCAGEGGDDDGDDYCGLVDNCPGKHNPLQEDGDGDGVGDACDIEECDGVDNDGDGEIDEDQPDADGDGVADCVDQCHGADDTLDEDVDGVPDCVDVCPGDSRNDPDEDGLCWAADNCPLQANYNQSDRDGDGLGDVCDIEECDGVSNDADTAIDEGMPDEDGDGLCDAIDPCLGDPQNDIDGDGVCGADDSCPTVPNQGDGDADGDGIGDACDLDAACSARAPLVSETTLPPASTFVAIDTRGNMLYAIVDSNSADYQSDFVAIDLPSRSLRWRAAIGGRGALLRVSEDGSRAWLSIQGAATVKMVDVDRRRVCGSFSTWADPRTLVQPARLHPVPGEPEAVVVESGDSYDRTAYYYEGGIRRALGADIYREGMVVASADVAYTYDYSSQLVVHEIGANGFEAEQRYPGALTAAPAFMLGGLLYATNGLVVDPGGPLPVATLPSVGIATGSDAASLVYFARSTYDYPDYETFLDVWDARTWTYRGSLAHESADRTQLQPSMVRAWGQRGIVAVVTPWYLSDTTPVDLWIIDDVEQALVP